MSDSSQDEQGGDSGHAAVLAGDGPALVPSAWSGGPWNWPPLPLEEAARLVSAGDADAVIVLAADGEQAEAHLGSLSRGPTPSGPPVLVMAPTTPAQRVGLLRAGAADVIHPSAQVDEVVLRLNRAVAAHRVSAERDAALASAADARHQFEHFAYTASHDLKEPLRAVSGFATLLEQRYGDVLEGDGQTYLEFILDGADRLASMIGGLLELSRMTRHEIVLEAVDVAQTLEATITQMGTGHPADRATIDVDLGSVSTIRTDAKLLGACLSHLLSNAVKFVEQEHNPVVLVTGAADEEWVSLTVADEGIGVRDRDLDRVFELFTRLHRRETYPGHGIGLGVVALVAKRLGGDVTMTSQLGEGTQVTLRLPAATRAL